MKRCSGLAPAGRRLLHARLVGPGRERVHMEHGVAPRVYGQRDAKDPYDVHHHARLCLEWMERTTKTKKTENHSTHIYTLEVK